MNAKPTAEDIAEMRADGSFRDYLRFLTGRPIEVQPEAAPADPGYHIPRKGAWPCGTAPSGPTPPPCDDCAPTPDKEGEAA